MPKYKPLYSLYKGLKESKYDVPDSYASFQKTLTQAGDAGAKSRRGLYKSLKESNYDIPDTYEDFYKNLFVPVNSTTSRALKIGENPNTPAVNRYHQKLFDSVDPNKNGLNALSHRAVSQAKRAMNNVRKPVTAKYVNREGKPIGEEFAITPAKTVEDLDREYAQETTKNWENELHDQMADADKDAAKISDMFKSFIGSTDEVGSVWGNMTRGGGIAGTPHSVTTNNGILENTEARQLLAAGDYNRKRKELLQLEQDSRNGATFDNHSFFRGMYDAAKDTGILTGGASDLINAGSLLATKQDLDNGVHTKAGDMLMQQAVKNSNAQSQYGDNQGWMYTGGVITTNMAPFMVQIGSAGFSKGISNAIGKVVQGAASKVALGTMEKATGMAGAHIANYIGKVTGLTTKAFGKAIQYGIVGAAQANTVGLGNVANDVINRYTGQVYQDEQGNYKFGTFDSDGNLVHEGGEDFLTAFVKGDAAQTIEFATELAGGGIDAAGTALKNFVTNGGKKIINKYNMENVSKVIDFLLNNKVAKNARYLKAGADRTLGKVEVNSIVGESLEEELGIIANMVFTGDNKISDLWDEKQQSQIWGGMLLSIGLMKGVVAPFHAYNAKQYYSYKHKLNKADVNLSQLLGKEKWEELRNQIDATTNENMPEMVNKINRDVALGKNRQPVREYIQNLLIMRGYDIGNMLAAKKAVEDKGEGVSVKNMEKNQAYQQGRDAYGYDTHEIQLDQEDKQKSLAQLLGISEQQLASMSDEELESFSGRDDNIDRAIYDYQLSSARYEGVVDNARDQIDLEVQRAAQAVDMYTDKSRNTIRNATIKASGGLEDYGVYIISGNIATHDDGSIDVSNSDDMILYYDPTTNTVEHADAMMFAELGSEENADEVRSQAMADAKEKAIKETTGIIDGVVEVGTQFKTVDADGTEHTYEVLADNGDGTAMITIDGNVPTEIVKGENVQVPVSFEELQKMKDESDQQRLQAAKAQREQVEKERAAQQTQETEQTQPSFDFNQILNDDGNVVLADVLGKDGNTKYPNSQLFLIRDSGAKAKVVELTSDGSLIPHAVNKKDVRTATTMTLDEYKQAFAASSMIEDNSGENRGEIEVESPAIEDETTPEVAENTETTAPSDETTETPATEQTPAAPAITLEDGTIVPMLEDGNPDFSKLTAAQTAELYDNQFGEDADSIVSGYVSDAKKALDKANNMTVKGKTFVEQKASKDAKEKAIADAQAAYDSAIAIRDAYNERQLAKVEDTAEGRKELIEKARRKFARLKSAVKDDAEAVAQLYKETVGSLLHRLYDGTGIDVTDTNPLTAEEYVASNLGAHSLNYEGTETSKGVKQETGLSREDFAKTQLLAADGKGTTIDALVHSLWENRPSNLDSLGTQDIRNALIGVLTSGFKASEARSYVENIRIAQAEKLIEEERTAAENAAYYEQQKAKEEEEKKKAELENKAEEEKKKAEENIDLPAIDKQGEPINNNIIELAKWAKKQGLEIDPTSKLNSYADLFLMCKDGFGVSTLVPDEGKNINQVIYFPDNAEVVEQLGKLQEEFNAGRDLNHSSNIDSEITEGATFYDAATAKEFRDFVNEQTKFPDKLKEGSNAIEVPEDATDENPLGLQLSEDKVPFEIEGGKSGETYNINDDEDRQRLINDNKVDDKDILDIDMPKHVHKAIKELCKKMGLKVQFLYMGARSNGWIENGTMYLALDTEKATQFVFGHEMTHAIKQKNPEAYKELVKVAMAVTTRKKFEEDLAKVYQNYHGISGYNNVDDYVEEVVADNLGKFINDFDLAQKFSLRLNHPVLATILHAIQKIKSLLYGDFYKSVDALERIVEKAYVDTAKGEVTNSETGEDVSFFLRQKPEPKKKGVGYKVFVLKNGKLYPPMVANPNGAATPVGVWLDADAAPIAGESKTGRPQVKQGGKGTQGGSGKLAYRPGWHLGVVPYAIQFNRKDADGNKTLFPKNFVFAEVEYAADVDYQEEARQEGINPSGKYQHSLAGLKHLPTDGYYMYRTNPNPETDPWVITGAMKVNRILTRAEQAELVKSAGREPQQIQEGDIVTDDVVNSINQEIADAPKFSLKVYHGSGADFTEFDFDHMGEGAGSQVFGWGGYVTSSKKIGKSYATLMDNDPSKAYYRIQRSNGTRFAKKYPTLESFLHGDKQIAMNDKFTEQEKIDFYNEMKKLAEPYHNLYEVDIPDDNDSNYLDWDKPLSKKQQDAIREGLEHLGVDIKTLESKGQSLERTGENVYNSTLYIGLTGTEYDLPERTKGISKFLSSVGFTGIKYKAGRNFGGAKKGDTNYVIFKPEDMKITEHTKFSIKTYHGSQASFDHFDHSFMGSGEGAQAYGWGTYVSEVEGIAKAYAKQNAAKHGMPREYKIAQIHLNHAKYEYDKVQRAYDNSKAYIDSLKEDLQNYRESIARRKEKVAYFAQNNMPEAVDKLLKQIKRTEDTIKVTENDINMRTNDLEGWKPKLEEVKKKYEEEQKKFDAIPKPQIERNLYSVDIPDDTGENYIGWDEKMTPRMRDIRKEILEDNGYKLVDSDGTRDYFEDRDGKEYDLFKEKYKTGGTFYEELAQLLHSQKLASLALKEYGFDGVKVIANRNTGGNKEGKMNYVIFDENNAQITSHTKFSLRLKSAIEETETNPSDAQKESGNYKKGHIKFGGYDYTIENPKGSTRSGKDADGKEWKVTMHDTYGYIRGKFGKDGDHLDMFINDKADLDNWNGDVFVIDQVNPDGSFDEHKVMYGYDSMDDAEKAYLANYSKGWKGLGNITGASKDEFDKWLDTSNRKLKPFADYAKVKFSQAQSVSEPRYSLKDIKPVGVGAFGNIYNQFRGKAKAAIEFLKKLGSGEATAALHHHTIGDISLVWGDKKTGLDKILRKHPEVVDNLQSIIDSMEVVQESDNRIKLESPTHFAVVSKEYKGEPREQWLLTAYEKRESLENGKSMDTATSSLGGDTALSQSKGSAAKIDNSSETAKENGEKFSLKDEKTMFGMHNISLDKLRKAIKQGGFAAPSMGVIDSKNGIYSGYGEITLIPKAEKIAKRTGKNIGTYAADAWTPIYPPVEKKFGGNGGDVAYDDIESVPKEMQRLTRNAINSFMDGREANGLDYLYLQEKGKAPELVHVEGKYPKELHDEVKGILGKLNSIYNTTDEQKEKLLDLFIREVYDGNKEEFDNDIKKFIKKDEEFIKKRPNSNIAKNKQLDVDWMKEHGYDYGALSRFVDGILRDADTSGKVDENATMKAAQQYIQDKGMKEDFDSWKEKLNDRYNVEEVIFAGYKPDGNRKYLPNTVENAVKVMKQDGKNASVGSASFSHFVASILKPMGTLDQIRNKKGNLTGNYEDVEKFQEKWQPVYDELADKMQPDAEPFESYGMDRLEEVATQKNPKKYAKEEYGVDLTDEDINKLNELIEAVKNDKPSIYFETKFMRPYGLDEFEKAIVPNDTPSDVVDALKMAGIDVSSYERGNAEDRQKVTMDAINSSDNIRFSLKSMMAKPEGWKQANKKAIHIAEAIERDPKFSLKNLDGTLIKAGTYFSGGGLVEEGLKGIIDPVVAVEYDEKISGVYRNNFGQHIVTADVRDVDPKELVKQIDGEVEYFHASPVCKNYSQAKSNHAEVELDKETAASTAEFINAIKPKVVTIENVKGYKDSEAMKTITDALDANGYTWDADVYNAADYGGYTNRERLIVRAVRDGKLPDKPKKMAQKSGWYEAVADIIPTLTEKKNGVAPWMDIRLKADGIDWRNIDKPLYVMGSAYADGKIPHAFADELLPTLRTKSGDVIVMPDGKVYRAMGRVLARVSGVSDDYKMPFSENLSHTIIGNGIPTQLTEHVIAPLLQNTLRPTTPEDGNTRFSLRYDQFEHDLNQWKKDNNLPKDAQRPTIPQRNAGESAVDFLRRVDEYRKQMALWKTAPTYEQHLLSDDTALGEFNRELQKGSVLKRIAFQDSMLAIRKAQEAIMKEVGVDRLNMAEDAYTAENRSHGKGKNEFEEYNNEFLQPLRKAYHQMKKVLGDSYDNVRIYMMAKHGLERDAQMAFKKSLEADYEDVAQRSAAYKAYRGDMNRMGNDSGFELGYIDFTTWRQRDNALRVKYSPSYMNYRYDKMGIAYDYSGLSALFGGSDFEEAASKLVRDIESSHVVEVQDLWNATNAATKKILRDGYKAGMMSKDTYQYVRDMYSHYIPLRGWDGTTADQVWDYIGGGKGAFNQTLKTAHGRTSIADDPIAYIENMAESGILLNNKNWVKQHLMLLAQNHPTSLLTLSKAWYVKSTDANGNEEWIPATPQITSQMDSNQVKAAIDAFEQKMEQMAQTGDATQKRDGLNIAYPQTHSEEREHEVRVMKDGEEYVIYVNGDPQLAQAMNNTRAHRVREIQSGKLDRAAAWLGRKMAAAYTSLSPLFIPSNYFRDLTMTLASTAIREDGRYNYLLRKNLATSWNLGFMLRDYQNGKLREKVSNGNATPKEQMFYDFMMNGGETGFVSSLDVEDLKKKFKNDLKDLDRWKTNPVKVGHTIMDGIEFLNRAIEDSNRFAVYMTSIQYGRSIDEAVNDAKDVTLNFNRKGTGEYGWQMIRNLYLFINPAVQSLQTLGALVKHHPFKFTAVTASWLASGVLVPVVNAALMSLLGGDDDKDKYWQFTKWDRRNNLIMWVPFTHEYVKIPLAQEFRAFYGLGDMIASKMMGGELAEESWSQYAEDLLGQVVDMLPLDPTGYDGNIAVSLMPNAIRPVFELAFNVDFTGKPLFKDTEYNKYDPNFTKAYVGTPDWLVRASRMMNSIGNDYPDVQQNKWDALGNPRYNLNNPAVVDHVLSSYLGGAYTMGSQVLGLLTKSLNDRKEIKVADIPLVSKFVSNPDDRPVSKKQGDEFWDKKEYYDRASNTISKLKKQAKIDGDYSLLERFYGSEEYKTYKLYEKDVKDYKEARKKERAEESGDEYRPHQLNAEDIYNNHATPMDEFEDMKLKQLFEKLNSFKTRYDAIVDNAPNQSEGYYNTNKAAIDAIDEISLDKQEISELKKGFLDDGKDAYNAEDMKQIRDLRKKILAVLEKANKVVVANQKAKAKKK